MIEILITVLPVFILIGAGYAAMWARLMTEPAVDALAKFAQQFAIPCLLFSAVANLDLHAHFNAPVFASYYIPAAIIFTLGCLMGRFIALMAPSP